MPRANRYIQPGCLYHLTHRCHDRKFLFRFALTRDEYRRRLRTARARSGVSLLNYCVTSNHTHLLAEAPSPTAISEMIHRLDGEFAQWHNRRKRRSGAFWEDRYHCTLVDGGEHAFNCIRYIDLNMVRAGVVDHPQDWRWCGHDELTGQRRRYRLLDFDCVLKWLDMDPDEFRSLYAADIEQTIRDRRLARDPVWTESVAVGGRKFVERICGGVQNRRRLKKRERPDGVWTVREADAAYVRSEVTPPPSD